MGRPRKDQEGASARERLERAFWELLEEMPYGRISVRAISEQARVNHNTFYYHFDGIDDLAMQVIDENIPGESISMVVAALEGAGIDVRQLRKSLEVEERWKRFRLMLRNGDAGLRLAIRDKLLVTFVQAFGLEAKDVGLDDRAKITFVFGGISALASSDEITTPGEYLDQLADGIVDAVIPLLRQIIERHASSGAAA